MHMKETLGERIKRLRENENKTQQQIADLLHLNRKAIGRYEHNEREPSLDTIVVLAKCFHVTTDYLLGASRSRMIGTSGLTEKEYLLIKELVSVLADRKQK